MQTPRNGRTTLIGEDEPEVRGYLEMALKCMGYAVESAQDGDEVLSCLQSSRSEICLVLLDLMMPNRDGLDALKEIRRIDPSLPVIVMSGASSTVNVVTAMKCGATDFLCKPLVHEELQRAVSRAVDLKPAELARPLRNTTPGTQAFVGSTQSMKEIQGLLGPIGWSDAPVLIQGETGSGKEVIARELHAQSPRAKKAFLKVNCAALPSELVESELFGYERGAFTGAFQKKAGMFEIADGGTILLDEIGDMDVRLQAKLLQVLQDQEFQRIGGKETIKVDVRILAATHQDLEKAIVDRRFREDLYYRLNVINILLPPLRERKEDIIPMAEFLLRRHTSQSAQAPVITMALRQAMTAHHWPGNVREMENFVRKFIVLRDADALARELHAKTMRNSLTLISAPAPAPSSDLNATLALPPAQPVEVASPILEQVTKAKQQAETEAILAALNSTRWNRKQAAALLKIDYKALLYKMKKLGVDDKPVPMPSAAELPASIPSLAALAR
ncbi:MAG: sigma-54 dependent transcriptional regulator [Bryobacteraceae bacterium]